MNQGSTGSTKSPPEVEAISNGGVDDVVKGLEKMGYKQELTRVSTYVFWEIVMTKQT